jgi:CHAD domain-containing protein
MPEGKWIGGLTPDMPVETAARHVLAVRLEGVRQWLPRAVHEAQSDPENVHQLRVATRRADAAFRIFRCCLPGRTYKSGRGRLRTIRRAAGAARDWDVFVIDLRQRMKGSAAKDLPGLDLLAGYGTGQRVAAQAILDGIEVGPCESFTEFIVDHLEQLRAPRVDGDETPRLIELARSLLAALMGELHEKATGDLSDYDRLHQVRIAGKRLRYALEVFADCFVPDLRERLYPMVEEVQEVLGRANDSHVAVVRLTDLCSRLRRWEEAWDRIRPGLEGLLRFHKRRLPLERRRFLKWWDRWSEAGPEAVLAAPFTSAAPTE